MSFYDVGVMMEHVLDNDEEDVWSEKESNDNSPLTWISFFFSRM